MKKFYRNSPFFSALVIACLVLQNTIPAFAFNGPAFTSSNDQQGITTYSTQQKSFLKQLFHLWAETLQEEDETERADEKVGFKDLLALNKNFGKELYTYHFNISYWHCWNTQHLFPILKKHQSLLLILLQTLKIDC